MARSISLVSYNIVQFVKAFKKIEINYTWENLCRVGDLTLREPNTSIVKWIKTPILFVKLNSDGSYKNGECGGGGVVRDSLGKVIMAYSIPFGQGTSN